MTPHGVDKCRKMTAQFDPSKHYCRLAGPAGLG
jgi:hypothetical protein